MVLTFWVLFFIISAADHKSMKIWFHLLGINVFCLPRFICSCVITNLSISLSVSSLALLTMASFSVCSFSSCSMILKNSTHTRGVCRYCPPYWLSFLFWVLLFFVLFYVFSWSHISTCFKLVNLVKETPYKFDLAGDLHMLELHQ